MLQRLTVAPIGVRLNVTDDFTQTVKAQMERNVLSCGDDVVVTISGSSLRFIISDADPTEGEVTAQTVVTVLSDPLPRKRSQELAGDQYVRDVPGTPYATMNWHGYEVVVGSGKGPYFFNEIAERRNKNQSNIIIITGAPGDGKSYFAIRLGQILDPDFDVNVQVVFERHMLMRLIGNDSPLHRGQVIVVDEAQYVAGARRWYEEVQKDLMENIEAVRSRGYIIIIVALHLNLLDAIIRRYVLSFMIHMEERGHGTIYRLYTPRFASEMYRNRLGALRLLLPDAELCSSTQPDCLVCSHRGECITVRAVYERMKRAFTGKKVKEAEESALRRVQQAAAQTISDEDLVKIMHEKRNTLTRTRVGSYDLQSIQVMLQRETKTELSSRRCHTVRALYALLHSDDTRKSKHVRAHPFQ